MKIAIASDHGAVPERKLIAEHLRKAGHDVHDYGCDGTQSVDYPDYAAMVCHDVVADRAEYGVVLCTTGIGVCMAANKIDGIRAATVCDTHTAEMTRRHNNANVICMGAGVHSAAAVIRAIDTFIATPFDGGRHARRVAKIMALESNSNAAVSSRDA